LEIGFWNLANEIATPRRGNPKSQAANPKQIQKSKVKDKNDKSKPKIFKLYSVILHFYFYIFRFEGVNQG
jgi:hypothetical protein